MAVLGEYSRTIKGRKEVAKGMDGVIYRMIVALADGGFVGERFEAHDGRMVCLEGVINKLAVPVRFGGDKRRDD